MPDITMCTFNMCSKCLTCYRFMAIPNQYQSYADLSKVCLNDNYAYFYEIDDRHKIKI